jgi:hypothetical protein
MKVYRHSVQLNTTNNTSQQPPRPWPRSSCTASASVSMKPHEGEIEKNLSNLVVSKPAAVRRVPFVIQIAFLSPPFTILATKGQ